jgi:peptidoglycan/xylan/chitin deacetylase (PgdA/CDA1 family)
MAEGRRGRILSSPLWTASVAIHGAGAATALALPDTVPIVAAAIVANHAVISTAGLFPRSPLLGPNITRLPRDAGGGRALALTFDDGPDPDVTPRVLALLASAGASATFFCIGQRAEAHADLVAAIRAAGHGVENHSHSHPNGFALRGPRGMAREVARAQEAIVRSGAPRPRFFRAPAGIQNPFLHGVLSRADLSLVSWTRRGFDTISRDGRRVAARLIGSGLRAGDILLLHDRTTASSRRGRPVLFDALSRVLDEMARRGLQSTPIHRALPPDADLSVP